MADSAFGTLSNIIVTLINIFTGTLTFIFTHLYILLIPVGILVLLLILGRR